MIVSNLGMASLINLMQNHPAKMTKSLTFQKRFQHSPTIEQAELVGQNEGHQE